LPLGHTGSAVTGALAATGWRAVERNRDQDLTPAGEAIDVRM